MASPTLVPRGGRLIHGNELLARVEPEYDAMRRRRCAQHTVARVLAVLRGPAVGTPPDWECPPAVADACGVFVGYLALDALIGNQDRHHENWGLLRVPSVGRVIAPSFDHASSLGRNEPDSVREERLCTRDAGRSVAVYVCRARSGLYKSQASPKPLSTLDASSESRVFYGGAARYWRDRIADLSPAALETIVERLPAAVASEWARRFALEIMLQNRLRILALE